MIFNQHDLSGLPDPKLDEQFYAGVPYKRLFAWIVDVVIFVLLYIAVTIMTLGLAAIIGLIAMLAVNFAYRAFMLTRKSATLGMIFVGIELRDKSGNRFDQQHAMWHTGLHIICFIFFPLQIISIAMMLVGNRGQGLHDYFLGTTAINRPLD